MLSFNTVTFLPFRSDVVDVGDHEQDHRHGPAEHEDRETAEVDPLVVHELVEPETEELHEDQGSDESRPLETDPEPDNRRDHPDGVTVESNELSHERPPWQLLIRK